MSLSVKHPGYVARLPDWLLMRDSWEGERIIKFERTKYLPPTSVMREDGMETPTSKGSRDFGDYLERAVYHEMVKPTVEAMLGVMHKKPPTIELPSKLEDLRKVATFNGESLNTLLVRINEQQLLVGRLGAMLDVPDEAKPADLPYVVLYNAETINNWDTSRIYDDNGIRRLQFVVLNETAIQRGRDLQWISVIRYRVLADPEAMQDVWPGMAADVADAAYVVGEADRSETIAPQDFKTPQLAGAGLPSIPFYFIGPRDLVPEPDIPPLLGLARLALAAYRGEADYRQALHMQAQGTLVFIGLADSSKEAVKVGANNSVCIPMGGDAKYVMAGPDGLNPMAESIQEDERRAARLGATLLDQKGNAAESGDAMAIRSAAKTCTLNTIADAGAGGLERLLRSAAVWVDADPDEVKVIPNKVFAEKEALAQDVLQLMQAKMQGAPISKKSIHGWLVDNNFTDLEFDDEMEEIDQEEPIGLGTPGLAGDPRAALPGAKPGAMPGKPGAMPAKPGAMPMKPGAASK